MNYDYYSSPIGPLLLAGDNGRLHFIGFPEGKGRIQPHSDWTRKADAFPRVTQQLEEYFAGHRTRFDLPLVTHGTPFQLAVLQALQTIPYGETRSYRDLAQQLGNPRAVRAVGSANGRNPLPIVIPCHRVIGADGSLAGFGGGLPVKRFLLQLEQGLKPLFPTAANE